jgi:cytosine deaminase
VSDVGGGSLAARVPRSLLDPTLTTLPHADADGLVAVRVFWADGRVRALEPLADGTPTAGLPLALTPLIEPHAHLDKAFTAAAFPNREGTMEGAMAANRREFEQRTAEQVLERGERALECAWRHGVRAIRTHVDGMGAAALPSWQSLRQLQQRWRGRVELQLVLLASINHWSTAEGEAQARELAAGGGLMGGVLGPPYRFEDSAALPLLRCLRLADQVGAGLDLHVDESAEQPGRGVALLTSTLIEQRLHLPLTCSHASSLGLLGARRLEPLAERMARAGLSVVALPSTNLWLLGRRPLGTPNLRPLAPVLALQQAGITVAVGGDNVHDPWFPGGDFDPLSTLGLSTVAFHLAPWLRQGLAPFTTAAARLLGLEWDGVLRQGGPADLVVLGVNGWGEMLCRPPQRRVLRQGAWLEPPSWESPSPLLACCR